MKIHINLLQDLYKQWNLRNNYVTALFTCAILCYLFVCFFSASVLFSYIGLLTYLGSEIADHINNNNNEFVKEIQACHNPNKNDLFENELFLPLYISCKDYIDENYINKKSIYAKGFITSSLFLIPFITNIILDHPITWYMTLFSIGSICCVMACNFICAEHFGQREILMSNEVEINIANSLIKLTSLERFKNKNDNKNISLD